MTVSYASGIKMDREFKIYTHYHIQGYWFFFFANEVVCAKLSKRENSAVAVHRTRVVAVAQVRKMDDSTFPLPYRIYTSHHDDVMLMLLLALLLLTYSF